jgi:hypothetical protein
VKSISSRRRWDWAEIVHFIGLLARESTMDKMSAEEKKFKGFPMFFTFENFKKSILGDMKQWWSRH